MSTARPTTLLRSPAFWLATGLAAGMVAGFFSFGGWWDLNKVAGEVREPSRTLPREIALGVIVVTVIYLATSAAFIYLVPFERVQSSETFAAQAGEVLFGGAGARIFSAVVVLSVLGSLMAVIMTAPRVYYAMASDGLFFKAVKSIHPRFGTPARAVAAHRSTQISEPRRANTVRAALTTLIAASSATPAPPKAATTPPRS